MLRANSFKLQRTLPTVALSVLLSVGMVGTFTGCSSPNDASQGEIQGEVVPTETQQETAPDQAEGGASLAEQDTEGTENINNTSGDKTDTKATADSGSITKDEALQIALTAADLEESDVTVTKNTQTTDDGVSVYEVEFKSADNEYEYTINSTDGTILEQNVESLAPTVGKSNRQSGQSNKATAEASITEDEAKAIATERAGVAESDADFTSVKLDTEDGVSVYEVDFIVDDTEYDVTINATTSEVMEYNSEAINR